MAYEEGVTKIPAAGISTNDANWLSAELKKNPNLQVHYTLGCHEVGRAQSANVIAEWRCSEFPDQVMVVYSPRGFGMVLFYYLCERRLQFD